jgi:hypothetical protein
MDERIKMFSLEALNGLWAYIWNASPFMEVAPTLNLGNVGGRIGAIRLAGTAI